MGVVWDALDTFVTWPAERMARWGQFPRIVVTIWLMLALAHNVILIAISAPYWVLPISVLGLWLAYLFALNAVWAYKTDEEGGDD